MKTEIISEARDNNDGSLTITIALDSGIHRRTFEIPIRFVDLIPSCSTFADIHVKPHRIASLSTNDRQLWVFRGKLIKLDLGSTVRSEEEYALEAMHAVLRHDRRYAMLQKTIRNLELLHSSETSAREIIPEKVRIFVWQRDQGRCTRCGSNERLEFDHIIPVSKGGSSTERNVQLLCESCNRQKGASI